MCGLALVATIGIVEYTGMMTIVWFVVSVVSPILLMVIPTKKSVAVGIIKADRARSYNRMNKGRGGH